MHAPFPVRFVALALAALVALAALPGAAGADQPTRTTEAVDVDFTIQSCDFPVLVHVEGHVTTIVFDADAAGTVRLFAGGPFVLTLTNPATGESLRVNISGPEVVRIAADGSATVDGVGPWVFYAASPLSGEPGIWLLRGRFVATYDADRHRTSFAFVGTSTNLCLDLAA
jgi:hypothetical protein